MTADLEATALMRALVAVDPCHINGWHCVYCGLNSHHASDCAWLAAKTWLGENVPYADFHEWQPTEVGIAPKRMARKCARCGVVHLHSQHGWMELLEKDGYAVGLDADDRRTFLCTPERENRDRGPQQNTVNRGALSEVQGVGADVR